jgi:hypothetical protein
MRWLHMTFLLATMACSSGNNQPTDSGPLDGGTDNLIADTVAEVLPFDLGHEVAPGDSVDARADVVDPPPTYHPLFDFIGTIDLLENAEHDGTFTGSQPSVRISDGPAKISHFLADAHGHCEFYQSYLVPPPCVPECDPIQEWCHADGTCRTWPQRVSAGEISFSGLLTPLTATPDETAWYLMTPPGFGADLFAPDATIGITAAGDEIPGFALQLSGVADLDVAWMGSLQLEDGQDNTLSWSPANDDSTMEVIIQTGWHGAPPTAIIWCTADDADGQLVVSQKLVEMFPQVPEIGLFQHPSTIRRVRRVVQETDFGPLAATAISQVTFQVLH